MRKENKMAKYTFTCPTCLADQVLKGLDSILSGSRKCDEFNKIIWNTKYFTKIFCQQSYT
mgnify:CR=1 FL=1